MSSSSSFKISASKNLAVAIAGESSPRHSVIPLGYARALGEVDIVVLKHVFAEKLTALIEHPLITIHDHICKLWETLTPDGDTYFIAASAEE